MNPILMDSDIIFVIKNLLAEILKVDIIMVPDFPGDLTDPPTVIVEGVHYLPLPFGSRTQVVNEENNNFSSHRKKEEATVYSKSRSQSSVAVFLSLRPRDQAPPPVASATTRYHVPPPVVSAATPPALRLSLRFYFRVTD
nr:hypothetical protein Iba_chr09cCG11700 [Ipomoea batatas]